MGPKQKPVFLSNAIEHSYATRHFGLILDSSFTPSVSPSGGLLSCCSQMDPFLFSFTATVLSVSMCSSFSDSVSLSVSVCLCLSLSLCLSLPLCLSLSLSVSVSKCIHFVVAA